MRMNCTEYTLAKSSLSRSVYLEMSNRSIWRTMLSRPTRRSLETLFLLEKSHAKFAFSASAFLASS